jgi:aarF domain-containing kinase
MGLIDFGATRQYSTEFMDNWYRLLSSVVTDDRDLMRKYSLEVGYLTGEEHEVSQSHVCPGHVKALILFLL